MNIIISNSSGRPIYEQITSQLKQLILTGELKPHDMLPSMRLLAKELRISVITTKRAYENLEKDGFIYTLVGKGSFVADTDRELLREEHLKQVEDHLEMAVRKKQISEGFVEEVPYDDIYTRDGGICQICGLPVHPVKNVDDNWDGTIDHIIPLSAGGEHSFANCQLAHRICNSLKRQEVSGFSIDWTKKSMENNYWGAKFEAYAELMAE